MFIFIILYWVIIFIESSSFYSNMIKYEICSVENLPLKIVQNQIKGLMHTLSQWMFVSGSTATSTGKTLTTGRKKTAFLVLTNTAWFTWDLFCSVMFFFCYCSHSSLRLLIYIYNNTTLICQLLYQWDSLKTVKQRYIKILMHLYFLHII